MKKEIKKQKNMSLMLSYSSGEYLRNTLRQYTENMWALSFENFDNDCFNNIEEWISQ
jgi:hypothetical protein